LAPSEDSFLHELDDVGFGLEKVTVGLSPLPKSGPRFEPETLRISTKSSAAAWRRFRSEGALIFLQLEIVLVFGKSRAMAMSLFPMSFHLSNTSSDRERAGLATGSAFGPDCEESFDGS